MKRSPPPARDQVGKRHCTTSNPSLSESISMVHARKSLHKDKTINIHAVETPARTPHNIDSTSSIKESKHPPSKNEAELPSLITQAVAKNVSCDTVVNVKHWDEDLTSFRTEQSSKALALGAADPSTKVCKICMQQVSRDQSHPRRDYLFFCGHSTCNECWSQILASRNVSCPWCRSELDENTVLARDGDLPMIHDSGTFTVHIDDRKGSSFDVPCCWTTKFGEILDFVAPMRVREFAEHEFPRARLQLVIKLNPGSSTYVELHEGHCLNDIAYADGDQIRVKERRLSSDDPIIAARLERRLSEQFYPNGTFTLKVKCFCAICPDYKLDGVNKFMKLSEIGRMIKAKLKEDDSWVDGDLSSIEVWGSVDRGIWNQNSTSLEELNGQGHGKKGKLYYARIF